MSKTRRNQTTVKSIIICFSSALSCIVILQCWKPCFIYKYTHKHTVTETLDTETLTHTCQHRHADIHMNTPPTHTHTYFFSVLLNLIFYPRRFWCCFQGLCFPPALGVRHGRVLDRNNLLFPKVIMAFLLPVAEVNHVLWNHSNSVVCFVGLNTLCDPSAPWLSHWSRLFTPCSVWTRPVSVDQEAQEAKATWWECGLADGVLALHAQIPGLILSTARAR